MSGLTTFCMTSRSSKQIEGVPTDQWLADSLASGDTVNDSLLAVADRATRAFRTIRAPLAARRQTFVGVGWEVDDGAGWVPWICSISNVDGSGAASLPRDVFTIQAGRFITKPGVRAGVTLHTAGQPLKRFGPHAVSPGAISDRLIRTVRAVAKRTPLVSDDVMINSIPLQPAIFESGVFAAECVAPPLPSREVLVGLRGRRDSARWDGGRLIRVRWFIGRARNFRGSMRV